MGDEAEVRVDEVCDAAGEGDLKRLIELERLWSADTSPDADHAQRRWGISSAWCWRRQDRRRGETRRHGDAQAGPPVHFSRSAAFKVAGSALGQRRLGDALDLLLDTEALTRTTAVPAEAVTGARLDEHRRHGERAR